MKDKVLFLDFDGVLFDTLREVYLINRLIYKNIKLSDEIDEKNYKLYSKYKYLVYNIWMFYYYNPLIFDFYNDIEKEFIDAIQNRNIEKENEFCQNFLNIRADLVKNNFEFWKNLEVPYDFFFGIKKLFDEKHPEIVVVSKKNKASILERFQTYNFKIDENKVFAREILDNYPTKGEFINEYMDKNKFSKALFVDDNYNNLKTCDEYLNIKQILALWGNSQPNMEGFQQQQALNAINNFFN